MGSGFFDLAVSKLPDVGRVSRYGENADGGSALIDASLNAVKSSVGFRVLERTIKG